MKRRIKSIVRIALLLSVIMTFSVTVSGQTGSEKKKLTLMLYMCGSNLESESGAASRDIQEILRTGYNMEEVNVLAMIGGSTKWWGGFSTNETAVYEISGRRPKKLYADGLLNMGQTDSLKLLLDYGYGNFPAEKYALVLWDHGGGPMRGVCWDSLYSADNLSMNELRLALQNSPAFEQPLEWIGFDACLMASVETAKLVSPFSHYTLSCIDLTKMSQFEQAADRFFEDLYEILNADTYLDISVGRQDSAGFGRSDEENADYDLVDMKDLLIHLADRDEAAANDLLEVLDSMILANSSSRENCYGLSVYHPYYNKSVFSSSWLKQYIQLGFSGAYQQYLRRFAAIWLGNKMVDWEELYTEEHRDGSGGYGVQMTPEQSEQFVSAQMIVLEEQENGFTQIFSIDEVMVDENGTLSAEYNMEQVFLKKEDGTAIGPLYYTIQDGEYIFPAIRFALDDMALKKIQYHCTPDEEKKELSIISTYIYDEISGTYTNRLQMENAQSEYIYFFNYSKEMTDDEVLEAFGKWEISEAVMVDCVKSEEVWKFEFGKAEDASNLYVTFQISDSQVNTVSSEPVEVSGE